MKIAIIGSGAMGSLFGGFLSKTTTPTLYDLNTSHIQTIQENGLRIQTVDTDQSVKIRATNNAAEIGPMDAVILFVKHPFTKNAILDGLKSAITEKTLVISLQNGLGNVEIMSTLLNEEQIVYGFSTLTSDFVAPGHINVTCDLTLSTSMWPLNNKPSEMLQKLCEKMNAAGLHTQISDEVEKDIWMKLLVNASFNSLCAITRQTVGGVVNNAGTLDLLHQIVYETTDVAQAKGIDISRQKAIDHVLYVAKNTMDHMPSMAIDVLNKKPTEIEAINGAIIKEGERLHVPTPATLYAANLIRCLESSPH